VTEVRIDGVVYVPLEEVLVGDGLARALAAEWWGDSPLPDDAIGYLRVHVTDGDEGNPLAEVVARVIGRLGEVAEDDG
jgi:hypothetical protein